MILNKSIVSLVIHFVTVTTGWGCTYYIHCI